jgi:hypothetical protein
LGPVSNPSRWGFALILASAFAGMLLQWALEARLREAGYVFTPPRY